MGDFIMKLFKIYYKAINKDERTSETTFKMLVLAKTETSATKKFYKYKEEPISRGWSFEVVEIKQAIATGTVQHILY